ncbi:hypothetical protein T03_1853 [Trichinella britovi]|uniref:Uncharacterized protein n=1 Tax=Trichinella britovi TaxID=45882 RepID=A0A0V1BYK3_TRIBR|nr:hypothetical protein T03_722 [Trichinella britovi]KRY45222.1 hypothetical protein T03_1853 [Trichinella britovi]
MEKSSKKAEKGTYGIYGKIRGLVITESISASIFCSLLSSPESQPTPFVDVDRRLLSQTNDAHLMSSALTAFLLGAVHHFFPLSKCLLCSTTE